MRKNTNSLFFCGYLIYIIATVSLRGPAQIYTTRREAPSLRMDGWMEYQKCPSNFFILCEYIEHVYTYLYIYSKIVTNFLIAFKMSYQVGVRGQKFKSYCR